MLRVIEYFSKSLKRLLEIAPLDRSRISQIKQDIGRLSPFYRPTAFDAPGTLGIGLFP